MVTLCKSETHTQNSDIGLSPEAQTFTTMQGNSLGVPLCHYAGLLVFMEAITLYAAVWLAALNAHQANDLL